MECCTSAFPHEARAPIPTLRRQAARLLNRQPAAASPVPDQPALKPAELDALVAPIALYPDTLLANVLMASTYPLEVVRAERWVNQNKNLKDDALKAAAEKQAWDASVKSLVAAPAVLQMMSERLDWTQKLGEAFLAQEQDVMDAVQRMRARAYDRKKLVTTKEQVVSVKQEQSRQVISIEPAVPDTLYVPYYEPQVVYGDWPYADYPAYPYYWGYPGYIAAGVIATGLAFGASLRARAVGVRRILGRRRLLGRQPHQLGRRRHQRQSRRPCRALAAQSGASRRRAVQQCKPAAEVWWRQSSGWRRHRRRRRRRRRRCRPAMAAGLARRGPTSPIAPTRRRQAQVGNRQAVHRAAGAGSVRAGNRAASRAGNFRPAAGVRHGGGARFAGGGGHRAAAFRGGAGAFAAVAAVAFAVVGGGRGGGRRSDIELKHDVVLLGRLDNGLGYYRFAYNGSEKAYVGVIAQEVRAVRPDAVAVGRDGYLRVSYERLGLPFRSYDDWVASGGRLPKPADPPH